MKRVSAMLVRGVMWTSASLSVFISYAIILVLLGIAVKFFTQVSIFDFLGGLEWAPGAVEPKFGIIPLILGTLLITLISLVVAVPLGLFSAIYLAEYAPESFRSWAKPALEMLAGIPTVVYGFFAAVEVGPLLHKLGEKYGFSIEIESALAVGLVMGVMVLPYISSLVDDVLTALPKAFRESSFGLGATQSETIRKVLLPAATPGIVAAILLATSRAIGETMIVVMAAGLTAVLTINPLESVTTITVQMVNLLVGDFDFGSPQALAAFALGVALFTITLALNIYAFKVVKAHRKKYVY